MEIPLTMRVEEILRKLGWDTSWKQDWEGGLRRARTDADRTSYVIFKGKPSFFRSVDTLGEVTVNGTEVKVLVHGRQNGDAMDEVAKVLSEGLRLSVIAELASD